MLWSFRLEPFELFKNVIFDPIQYICTYLEQCSNPDRVVVTNIKFKFNCGAHVNMPYHTSVAE